MGLVHVRDMKLKDWYFATNSGVDTRFTFKEIVSNLRRLGVTEIQVDQCSDELYSDTLYMKIPDTMTAKNVTRAFVFLAGLRPHEVSQEKDGWVRFWWD